MTIPSILMMVRMAMLQTAKPYMPYIDPKSKWDPQRTESNDFRGATVMERFGRISWLICVGKPSITVAPRKNVSNPCRVILHIFRCAARPAYGTILSPSARNPAGIGTERLKCRIKRPIRICSVFDGTWPPRPSALGNAARASSIASTLMRSARSPIAPCDRARATLSSATSICSSAPAKSIERSSRLFQGPSETPQSV